jgi:enamine deaminase RidA (YjgF/YER057c/UK114 family)/murein DD-endopeptidase MepM/ murein hydrolase activator NlpD
MSPRAVAVAALALAAVAAAPARAAAEEPLFRTIDLDVGESADVVLAGGHKARVKLAGVREVRDDVRRAVRRAEVKVEIDGRRATLVSGLHHLPVTVGRVQIDSPVTAGYRERAGHDAWGLLKAARLRLWPAGSPWTKPGTFVYPIAQRWLASDTWVGNEPVDAGRAFAGKPIYYHSGFDIGATEGLVDVIAAADAEVVVLGKEKLPGLEDPTAEARYDVVYLRDARNWYYRYSHLKAFDPALRLGARVRTGQRLGTVGKEGGSGGWSHLHFEMRSVQPSGKWGTLSSYAFAWEAYRRQYAPPLVAVSRPRQLARAGQRVSLDGSLSWAASGKIARYRWTFTDGRTAFGPRVSRIYDRPGTYSEVLEVSDAAGRVDYDFAIVQVLDPVKLDASPPPRLHATYAPSLGLRPGDRITFKVRAFDTTHGEERWDFGDGSPAVTTRSDGNVNMLAPDGYAVTEHRYRKPGHYIVRVERGNEAGATAVSHLHVEVGTAAEARAFEPDAATGTSAAVEVGRTPLAHTAQLLPIDARGEVAGRGNAAAQVAKVLDNLEAALAEARTGLDRVVKLNVAVAGPEVVPHVSSALARRLRAVAAKPAVAFVAGALPRAGALVAMDAVAATDLDPGASVRWIGRAAPQGAGSRVAVLAAGPRAYVSGSAAGGDLAEGTRKTLDKLRETLAFLGLGPGDVVQLKVFVTPAAGAAVVEDEVARFFGAGAAPPLVFVEWRSAALPIEIELVAAARGGAAPLEHLALPGEPPSPLFSRVARTDGERTIFVSGLRGAAGASGLAEVEDLFASLGHVLTMSGSDLGHLVKATYYVSDEDASRSLNEVRRRLYDPRRSPAASKALVPGVALERRTVTMDLIAVPRRDGAGAR